jgi:hypothetical protein
MWVIMAGDVIVGDCELLDDAATDSRALARPKSSTLTVPSGRTLMLAGFRSRWMIPCSWAAAKASAILLSDWEGLIERDRPLCQTVGDR